MNYKDFFKDKKIAVIGLGPHGEMLTDIKFLLKSKVDIFIYDIRSEGRVHESLYDMKLLGIEKYKFGKINDEELLDFDLILLSTEISKKSFFLKKANNKGVQIEYPDILFFKLVQPITLVGVLGVYGKSTVAHLVYSILKKSFQDIEGQGLYLIDPDSNSGALTHLKKIKKGDVVIARIPESLLSNYHSIHISPQVAIFTSVIPFKILEFQTHNNFIVASDEVIDAIKKEIDIKAKILRTRANTVPNDWIHQRGVLHDRENASLALQTSELFKVSRDISREVIQGFLGLKGHIEMVKKVNNVSYYNDSSSVSPKSTISAIESLSSGRNIVLIMGGAYTGYDYNDLIKKIPDFVSTVILLPGSGTIGIRKMLDRIPNIKIINVFNLDEAVEQAKSNSNKGDIVLFSPAFDAVGIHISRTERGEKFVKAVRKL